MSAPPVTSEVTSALVRMLAGSCGHPVGDGQAPPDAVERDGYVVVEMIGGGVPPAEVSAPFATAVMVAQVAAVGRTRLQAQQIADACRTAILGRSAGTGAFTHPIDTFAYPGSTDRTLAGLGVAVWSRAIDSDGGILMEGLVFNAPVRYALGVQPA